MEYFSNLEFVNYGISESANASVRDRYFENYWGLQFVWKGDLFLQVGEGRKVFFTEPAAFITFPGAPFSYGTPPGKNRHHAYCCFKGERIGEYIQKGFLVQKEENPLIPIAEYQFFLEKFRLLIRELRSPGAFHHARSVLLLEELLLLLQESDTISSSRASNHFPSLRHLLEKIVTTPEKEWDFAEEAANLSLSYSHFRFLFKELTGHSPWNYLLECRIRKGEELLLSTSRRVNEIAADCGFEDEFHFSRFFRKNRGLAPSIYRRKFQLDVPER